MNRSPMSDPDRTRCEPAVWGAVIVAFILHTTAIFLLGHYHAPILWENGEITRNLLAGKGFSINFAGPDAPTSWQAPGYPYVLYFLLNTFGEKPATFLALSLFQALITALIPLPVFRLARNWYGRRPAVLAAWIAAAMPLYAWYSTRIHQPAFVMSIYPWLVLGWLEMGGQRLTAIRAVLTGFATGVAAHFSPTLLAVFGLLSGSLALRALIRREFRPFRLIVIAGCFTLLAITPWTIRNYQVHGRFVPIKNSFPKEFWYGNCPQATGTPFVKGGQEPIAMPDIWHELYGKVSEIELMDAILEKTMANIRADRPAFMRRTIQKAVWFWTAVPRSLLRSSHEGEAVKFYWLHTGYWTLFLLIGLAGLLARHTRPPGDYTLVLAIVFLVYSAVYGLTIVGNARFRGEIEFLLIPIVSAVLCTRLFPDNATGRDPTG